MRSSLTFLLVFSLAIPTGFAENHDSSTGSILEEAAASQASRADQESDQTILQQIDKILKDSFEQNKPIEGEDLSVAEFNIPNTFDRVASRLGIKNDDLKAIHALEEAFNKVKAGKTPEEKEKQLQEENKIKKQIEEKVDSILNALLEKKADPVDVDLFKKVVQVKLGFNNLMKNTKEHETVVARIQDQQSKPPVTAGQVAGAVANAVGGPLTGALTQFAVDAGIQASGGNPIISKPTPEKPPEFQHDRVYEGIKPDPKKPDSSRHNNENSQGDSTSAHEPEDAEPKLQDQQQSQQAQSQTTQSQQPSSGSEVAQNTSPQTSEAKQSQAGISQKPVTSSTRPTASNPSFSPTRGGGFGNLGALAGSSRSTPSSRSDSNGPSSSGSSPTQTNSHSPDIAGSPRTTQTQSVSQSTSPFSSMGELNNLNTVASAGQAVRPFSGSPFGSYTTSLAPNRVPASLDSDFFKPLEVGELSKTKSLEVGEIGSGKQLSFGSVGNLSTGEVEGEMLTTGEISTNGTGQTALNDALNNYSPVISRRNKTAGRAASANPVFANSATPAKYENGESDNYAPPVKAQFKPKTSVFGKGPVDPAEENYITFLPPVKDLSAVEELQLRGQQVTASGQMVVRAERTPMDIVKTGIPKAVAPELPLAVQAGVLPLSSQQMARIGKTTGDLAQILAALPETELRGVKAAPKRVNRLPAAYQKTQQKLTRR